MELLLIRWVSAEIRIFSYFRNLVLISCFLGLGIGFNLKKYRMDLSGAIIMIVILAALVHPRAELYGISFQNLPTYMSFSGFHMWHTSHATTALKLAGAFAMVAAMMMILAAVFVPFGQILGKIFENSEHRIRDYSINLLGSLFGTWVFALLSYFWTPPWVWFLIGVGGMVLFLIPRSWKTVMSAGMLALILVLVVTSAEKGARTYWSPYQKLTISRMSENVGKGVEVSFLRIDVNSNYYLNMLDLSDAQADRYPEVFIRGDRQYYPYDIPFRLKPNARRVLVVGAGAGNDVAGAIRNGATSIDAVEIDPVIALLGKQYHPEHPYQDPRVNLVINDARSFFKQSSNKYDLIIFGLLDSHTLTSNFTNINLDSYVYTLESIKEAKNHLAPGGVLMISFFTERKWLGYKLFFLMKKAFGENPILVYNTMTYFVRGNLGDVFLSGDIESVQRQIRADPTLAGIMAGQDSFRQNYLKDMVRTKYDLPTDDWPYLYLREKGIPTLHLIMTAILILFVVSAVLFLFPRGRIGSSHFLFLGAGFMLVEVHSISKVALLFGSTWIVNVVIISAIMVMILAANLLVLKYQVERVRWWYAGLFLSLALAYLIPIHHLLIGGYLVRGLLAGAFYSLPLFFAGVIFSTSIKKVAGMETAFASNMVGAAIGGMLESASYVFGLRAVVLIAILLYLLSALALRRMPVLNRVPGPVKKP